MLHGIKRNPDTYRDAWQSYANQKSLMVLVPSFTRETYPGSNGYNLGNMYHARTGAELTGKALPAQANPKNLWSFSLPDAVFNDFKTREETSEKGYTLFGHGAGAQFANRFAMFTSGTLACRVIAANPGWYTYPDKTVAWPYGIKDVRLIDDAQITRYLQAPLTLMLGEDDVKKTGGVMRNTGGAKAEGDNRNVRADRFVDNARQQAAARGVTLQWQFIHVPGAGHDDAQMAPAAIRQITGCPS